MKIIDNAFGRRCDVSLGRPPRSTRWEELPDSDLMRLVQLLAQAAKMRRQKQYKRALALYKSVIERFGDNARLLSAIADCHVSLAIADGRKGTHNRAEAVTWMEKALALDPGNGRLHARLAQALGLDPGKWHLTAERYRQALELSPYDSWALVKAASLRDVAGDVVKLGEAIGWMERATWLEPNVPDYHVRLGDLYLEAGRGEDAQREWVKALLSPRLLDVETSREVRRKLGIDISE